jgi:ribose-phosphate pyrophosphokinase
MSNDLVIFSGSSHGEFAKAVTDNLSISLGQREIIRFSNDNIWVQIQTNVREKDVFVIQTASTPVQEHLMEMLIMIDALKHASAKRITAVLPYYPYARSDKKDRPRISVTARLVADLLETAGADRVLTMDLHSPQVQGFFRIPSDQLRAINILCHALKKYNLEDAVLVAADAGEAKGIGGFANRLRLPFAIIDKRRYGNDEKPKCVNIVGDVEGKKAIIIDDEISSAGTLVEAAKFLKEKGATEVWAAVTHGVFVGQALERINDADMERVIVTDTMPQKTGYDWLEYLTVTQLFAQAIFCIHSGQSISGLFENGGSAK